VVPPDRGQAEGAVLLGVLFAAGAEETQVDQADRGGQDPFPAQAAGVQMAADGLSDGRQGGPEVLDPVVLVLVPVLAPQIVVPVLTASGRIGADGLDVTSRVGADPDVLPGRRDDQGLDPGQRPRIRDRGAVRAEVAEAPPAAPAPDAGAVGVAAPQRVIPGGR
jgi:hypothetical protein